MRASRVNRDGWVGVREASRRIDEMRHVGMELTLSRQDATTTQVSVTCDGQYSHSFDLRALFPDKEHGLPGPFEDAAAYGRALFAALFAQGSAASAALSREYEQEQGRVLLVAADETLEMIPWEYAYGADGF